MTAEIQASVNTVLKAYRSDSPDSTAMALREYWLTFAPNQGIKLIKTELLQQIEAAGTPIPVLKEIGEEIARAARKDVNGYLPLARLLWDTYGREGRVIALIIFGSMTMVEPETLVPMLKEVCRNCITWEDADRLAMDAVEPIVRKYPERWMNEMAHWLEDPNKWVRRAAITIIGRLPMKHPGYTEQCLALSETLLPDTDLDVKRAVSFAIRIFARSNPSLTCAFLEKHIREANLAYAWVLSDVMKSMYPKILGQFTCLLPGYISWKESLNPKVKERRSLESAIHVLRNFEDQQRGTA